MTKDQIRKRIAALDDYEMSLHRNTWDDSDRVTNELLRVVSARSKLAAALREAPDKTETV